MISPMLIIVILLVSVQNILSTNFEDSIASTNIEESNPHESNHFQYDEKEKQTIILNSTNFKETILYGNHFIKFFTPWCGHCQRLAPIWLELSEYYHDSGETQISEVDCTISIEICKEYDVKGYPTLLFFQNGNMVEDYFGERNIEDLKLFVDAKINHFKKLLAVDELTVNNFDENLSLTFILFYIPTCPHCQNIFDLWRQFFRLMVNSGNATKIAMINCHEQREVCIREQVISYPAFIFYKNNMRMDTFRGPRELDAFIDFSNDMSIQNVEPKFEGELESYVINLKLKEFSNYKNFLFVKFFVPWCNFCKEIAPIWEEAASSMVSNSMIKFGEVDCSVVDIICKKYKIQGYPTMKIFLDGKFLDFYTGEHNKESIINYSKIIMSQHTEL